MARTIFRFGVLAGCVLSLGSCGFVETAQRAAWRNTVEQACLKKQLVKVSAAITPRRSINGPGVCGLNHPFRVTALAGGSVLVRSRATLGCPMIAKLDRWLEEVVQPAARERLGQPVTEIHNMASFGCRTRNNRPGAKMSEHSFGNALDIGGFKLEDGTRLKVVRHWRRGKTQERAFLRAVHAGACRYFRTVLGPGSDRFHENHFHFDLAMHGGTSRGLRHYCRPKIKDIAAPPTRDDLPDAPYLTPGQEIAKRMLPPSGAALLQPLGRLPRRSLDKGLLPPVNLGNNRIGGQPVRFIGRGKAPNPDASLRPGPDWTGVQPKRRSGYLRPDGIFVPPGH